VGYWFCPRGRFVVLDGGVPRERPSWAWSDVARGAALHGARGAFRREGGQPELPYFRPEHARHVGAPVTKRRAFGARADREVKSWAPYHAPHCLAEEEDRMVMYQTALPDERAASHPEGPGPPGSRTSSV
jgi:hypothetical protein